MDKAKILNHESSSMKLFKNKTFKYLQELRLLDMYFPSDLQRLRCHFDKIVLDFVVKFEATLTITILTIKASKNAIGNIAIPGIRITECNFIMTNKHIV